MALGEFYLVMTEACNLEGIMAYFLMFDLKIVHIITLELIVHK